MDDSSDEIAAFALGKRKRKKREPKYNVDEIRKTSTENWDNISSWLKLNTEQKENVMQLQDTISTSYSEFNKLIGDLIQTKK